MRASRTDEGLRNWVMQWVVLVKDSMGSAGDAGCTGLIPESGGSPGEGNGNPLQYSPWRIPWIEEPGGLQSMESQRVGHD